jgi:hypothetical protein
MTKTQDLIRVHARKGTSLHDLLTAWTKVVLRYCALHKHEGNPWWANERASLSTLAGAAWSLDNWCALEEFSTKKRSKIPKDKVDDGGLTNGRCDLYLSTSRTSYAVEAKQAWQSIGAKAMGCNIIRRGMRSAWKDAGAISIDEAKHRFAATFIVPYVTGALAKKHDVRKLVDDWLSNVKIQQSGKGTLAYAYVFPGNWKGFASDRTANVFPGVMLVLEERQRGNRRRRAANAR